MTNNGPTNDSTPSGFWLTVAGAAALVVWLAWWGVNLYEGHVQAPARLGYLHVPDAKIGGDFDQHYRAAQHFFRGENPWNLWPDYGFYNYTPATLPFFLWTPIFPPRLLLALWVTVVAAILVVAVVIACRQRLPLGLEPLPVVAAVAIALWSNPILFEVDRGQVDVVVLLLIWLGWRLSRRNTTVADLCAAFCFSTAIWMKVYPFLIVLGLAAVRRPRVLLATVAAGLLIGLATWKWDRDFLAANAADRLRASPVESIQLLLRGRFDELQADVTTWKHDFRAHEHSLADYAQGLLSDLGLNTAAKVPGILYASLLVLPLAAGLSWFQFRNPGAATELPLLLFLTCLGTFIMPLAWDYTLCLLVLVFLMVWSRHDPWPVQLCAAAFALYLFPFRPEFRAQSHIVFQCKLLGLLGTAWMLARRIRQPGEAHRAAAPMPENAAELAAVPGGGLA